MKSILKIITVIAIVYICFAFVLIELNPFLWEQNTRLILVNINLILSILTYTISHAKKL